MKIGLMVPLPGDLPNASVIIDQIIRAEALGFDSIWAPNVRGNDALTVLAVAGTKTSRIELGTFVVPTYTRHPVALAQQAITTNALAGNRLTLGIGLSHRVTMEGMLGFDWSHPIRHMREYLACLLPLMRGENVEFQGSEFTVNGYSLDIPGGEAPAVLVAALGPQMLKLAGKETDGTAIWMGGPRYLAEHAVPTISTAAASAGRAAPRILAGLPVCVTDNSEQAREFANNTFARYGQLPSYRAILDKEGAEHPADVALIGDAATVQAGLQALATAGVTDLAAAVFAPPGKDASYTYDVLVAASRPTGNRAG